MSSRLPPASSTAAFKFSQTWRVCTSTSPMPAIVPSGRRAVMPEMKTMRPRASTMVAWEKWPDGWRIFAEVICCLGMGLLLRGETARQSSGRLVSLFIAGRCKPKGCFRRPGIAAIAIVEKQVGCLRRLGIHFPVSRRAHHEVERLWHPWIARLRVGPGDNNGAEIGGSAGKLLQARDLVARAVALLRREEGRRSKLQGKRAIVAKRDVVLGVGRGLIIGVRMLPPTRCNEPDHIAHVRIAEPCREPGTCTRQP